MVTTAGSRSRWLPLRVVGVGGDSGHRCGGDSGHRCGGSGVISVILC